MKRYIKSSVEYDGYTYEDFIGGIQQLVEAAFPGCEVTITDVVRGKTTYNTWNIMYKDDPYDFNFKYDNQIATIEQRGVKRAAMKYARQIIKRMDQGPRYDKSKDWNKYGIFYEFGRRLERKLGQYYRSYPMFYTCGLGQDHNHRLTVYAYIRIANSEFRLLPSPSQLDTYYVYKDWMELVSDIDNIGLDEAVDKFADECIADFDSQLLQS